MTEEQEPKYMIGLNEFGRPAIVNRVNDAEIPEDEPTFIFRAQDVHAPEALFEYLRHINDEQHYLAVLRRLHDFIKFAHVHPDRMKEPDTKLQ